MKQFLYSILLLLPFSVFGQVLAPTNATTKLAGGTSTSLNSFYFTTGGQYGWLNGSTGLWEQNVTGRQITTFYYPRTHIDSVITGLIPIALINGITKNYYDPTSSIQGQLNYKLNINGSNANTDVNIYNNLYKTTKGFLMDTTFVDGSSAYLEANKTDFLYELFKPSTYDMSMYLTHNSVNMSYTETIGANTFAYNLNAQNHRVALDYNKNSLYSYFSIDTLGLHVKDTTYQRGPVGTAYYGANYTDNTYVQKKYVVDNFPHSVFMTPASGDLLKFNGTNWVNYAFTANSPLTYNSGLATVAIQMAGASQPGYISTVDWNTFNGKLSTTTAAATYLGLHATADNSTLWKGLAYDNTTPTTAPLYFMASADGGTYGYTPIANAQTALGLGSNAYTSTAYLPLTVGSGNPIIGELYITSPAGAANAPIIAIREGANPTYGWTWTQDDFTTGDFQLHRLNAGTDALAVTFVRNTGAVTFAGDVTAANLSGTNTGDETTARINALYGYTPANSAYVPIHGNYTNTLTGATVINVTIGSTMGNSSYYTSITPRDLITAVNYYISAQTTTSFAVTFISALTGSVSFDWNVIP